MTSLSLSVSTSLLDGILEFGYNATVLQLRYYNSAPAAVIVAVAVVSCFCCCCCGFLWCAFDVHGNGQRDVSNDFAPAVVISNSDVDAVVAVVVAVVVFVVAVILGSQCQCCCCCCCCCFRVGLDQ